MAAPIHPRGGRPRIADVPATASIEVRVTPAQHLDLREIAAENRTRVSTVIRDAVAEFCAERAERRARLR